jgi:hypothetical protein
MDFELNHQQRHNIIVCGDVPVERVNLLQALFYTIKTASSPSISFQ